MNSGFFFVAHSDQHYQLQPDGTIKSKYEYKRDHVEKIMDITKDYKIQFVVAAGDLTESGSDGKKFLCIPLSGKGDELGGFRNQYVNMLEKNDIRVYENVGNHDILNVTCGWKRLPVQDYVISRHGSTIYRFAYGGLQFFSLGMYPNKEGLEYISKQDLSNPTVIVFHYSLVGKIADQWWSKGTDTTREEVYEALKGKNIVGIICGHTHQTTTFVWNGINVFMGAGKDIPLLYWNPEKNLIEWVLTF